MAAIDPTEEAHLEEGSTAIAHPRATLKIIRTTLEDDEDDDEDDDDENEEYMRALLAESDSDEESDDEDEANGGPSDPTKSKKARKQAALQQLMDSIKADDSESDEEMEDAGDGEKKAIKKGKAPATGDEEDSEEESDDDEDIEVEEFVLCTLDPEKVSTFIPREKFFLTFLSTTNNHWTSPSPRMNVFSSRLLVPTPSISPETTLFLMTMDTTIITRSMTPMMRAMRTMICHQMRMSSRHWTTRKMSWTASASLKLSPKKMYQSS